MSDESDGGVVELKSQWEWRIGQDGLPVRLVDEDGEAVVEAADGGGLKVDRWHMPILESANDLRTVCELLVAAVTEHFGSGFNPETPEEWVIYYSTCDAEGILARIAGRQNPGETTDF